MEFDDDWINTYESNTSSNISSTISKDRTIKVFYCYIDKDNIFQKMNQDTIDITGGILRKDELVKLIITNKKKTQLLDILTYIITDVDNDTNYHTFLKPMTIDDISLLESHNKFESINCIFFMFKEFTKKLKPNSTRKVYITSGRKTKRKLLKATSTEDI
jgi:hypothetical protein